MAQNLPKEELDEKIASVRRKAAVTAAITLPPEHDFSTLEGYKWGIQELLRLDAGPSYWDQGFLQVDRIGRDNKVIVIREPDDTGKHFVPRLLGSIDGPLHSFEYYGTTIYDTNSAQLLEDTLNKVYQAERKFRIVEALELASALEAMPTCTPELAKEVKSIRRYLKSPVLPGSERDAMEGALKAYQAMEAIAFEESIPMASDLRELMKISQQDSITLPDQSHAWIQPVNAEYKGKFPFSGPRTHTFSLLHLSPTDQITKDPDKYLVELPPREVEGRKLQGNWELGRDLVVLILKNITAFVQAVENSLTDKISQYKGPDIQSLRSAPTAKYQPHTIEPGL